MKRTNFARAPPALLLIIEASPYKKHKKGKEMVRTFCGAHFYSVSAWMFSPFLPEMYKIIVRKGV